mmetsp:Transcript_71968/g.153908  ORF Transcript_71968/g.153908 Transcript_71968/m.153908 type:complete len:460 (+) Transcript_71968:156-1535(+)
MLQDGALGNLGRTATGWGGIEGLAPPSTPAEHRRAGSSTGPRARVGVATVCNVGKGTENQDTFVTSSSSSGSRCFVGVFDGHGERGKNMSEFSRNALTRNFFNAKDHHTNPRTALESAYLDTQSQIERTHGHEAAFSGTTAVSAYQHGDQLLVANVGDSRAVLGVCDTGRGEGGRQSPGNLTAVELSNDHKPGRSDERQRIQESGGTVQQRSFPVHSPGGGLRFVKMGPERVMDRTGLGGLAMSRSLGDLSFRPYVSAQPELLERQLNHKDKVLILGSDGVWDHISSQEAVNIAGRQRDPAVAAREIASLAQKRWQVETDGQLSDDITTVVVNLDHHGHSSHGHGHSGSQAPVASIGAPGPERGDRLERGPSERTHPDKKGRMQTPQSPSLPAVRRNPSMSGGAGQHQSSGLEGLGERLRRQSSDGRLEPLRRGAGGRNAGGPPSHLVPTAGGRLNRLM